MSAAQDLIAKGELEESRAGFVQRRDHIIGLGLVYYQQYLAREAGTTDKRGGARSITARSQNRRSQSPIFSRDIAGIGGDARRRCSTNICDRVTVATATVKPSADLSLPSSTSASGPLAMYGALCDWLDRRSQLIDPGPIRTILREHILDHHAYMPDERLLGDVVEKQRLHSVKSLASTLKTDRRRMSRLLQTLGLVPKGATDAESGRLVFRMHEVEQLIKDHENGIPLAEVPAYIGGTHRQISALSRAGLLPPVIPADAPGAVRRIIIARRVLDDLLARVGALPLLERKQYDQALSVAKACERHARPTDALIRDIMAKTVPAYRVAGKPRLDAVRVLASDMAALQHAAIEQN